MSLHHRTAKAVRDGGMERDYQTDPYVHLSIDLLDRLVSEVERSARDEGLDRDIVDRVLTRALTGMFPPATPEREERLRALENAMRQPLMVPPW